jgi:VWFA-related protein
MIRKVAVLVALPVALLSAQQQAAPTFKGHSELVLVPTTVQDKHGKHVSGLTKDDFKVLEDGKQQQINVFEEVQTSGTFRGVSKPTSANEFTNQVASQTATQPRRLTIIAFDLLNTPTLQQADARKALWDFLGEAADAMEPTAVYSIDSRGVNVVSDFTTDPHVLAEALKHLKWGRRVVPEVKLEGSPHEDPLQAERTQYSPIEARIQVSGETDRLGRMSAIIAQLEMLSKEMQLNATSQMRRYVVLDTLAALQQIAQACALIPGRKSLLWITGGFPFDISPTDMSILQSPFPAVRRDWTDVYSQYLRTWRALNDAQVVLYPIDVRGITNPTFVDPSIMNQGYRLDRPAALYQNRQTSDAEYSFAYATGGRAFYGSNNLKSAFEEAVRDSDHYYVLGYYIAPKHKSKAGWHTISVKGRSGLEIRARGGYFYNPTTADLQNTRRRDIDRALYSPIDFTAVPITARWTQKSPGEQKDTTRVRFELVMSANFAAIDQSDNNHLMLDVVALARTLEGKPVGNAVARAIDGHLNEVQLKQIQQRGLTYSNALELPAGEYLVRFVVRDGLDGNLGSVSAPLKVK